MKIFFVMSNEYLCQENKEKSIEIFSGRWYGTITNLRSVQKFSCPDFHVRLVKFPPMAGDKNATGLQHKILVFLVNLYIGTQY